MKDIEKYLGLANAEKLTIKQIFLDLYPHLNGSWIIVGGLPRRMYLKEHGKTWPWKFNDIDIAAREHSILSPSVTNNFYVTHHHRNDELFYFQMLHKKHHDVTIDIFQDHWGLKTTPATLFGREIIIPTTEEMFLFTMRDILALVDNPRGLPPKHIKMFDFFNEIIDRQKVEELWTQRHRNLPSYDNEIYRFSSLTDLIATLEIALDENKANVKPWKKSDPLAPCQECILDRRFPLYREDRVS